MFQPSGVLYWSLLAVNLPLCAYNVLMGRLLSAGYTFTRGGFFGAVNLTPGAYRAKTDSLSASPSVLWPANNRMVDVNIKGVGADAVSGLAAVTYVVTDEYGTPLAILPRTLSGNSSEWDETLALEARREGNDRNGRLYRVVATITDLAGNTSTAATEILVPHGQRER